MEKLILIRIKSGTVNGLLGKYYVWQGEAPPEDFSTLELITSRVDPQINFTWWDSPAPGVPAGYFAIEWTGLLRVDVSGIYRIYVVTDDGSRVWLDDELIIDAWFDQSPTAHHSKPLELDTGFYRIRYRFYNRHPFAVARLGWLKPDHTDEIIPSDNLVVKGGDNVVVRGLPDGYRVEFWSGGKIAEGKVKGGRAVLDFSAQPKPLDGYFKVLDGEGRLVTETPVVRNVWGGDEFEVARGGE